MSVIPKRPSINLIVHSSATEAGQVALKNRIAELHAAAVSQRLNAMKSSSQQKMELLDAVISAAKKRSQDGK